MKLRLIVFVSVAVLYGCVCCRAATNDAPSQVSMSGGDKGSGSPVTADVLLAGGDLGHAVALVSAHDRYSFSRLFSSWQPRALTPITLDGCPNNGNSCGDACCTSSQQCCVNSATGGHYCATKCNN
jgi:hypothetical protein